MNKSIEIGSFSGEVALTVIRTVKTPSKRYICDRCRREISGEHISRYVKYGSVEYAARYHTECYAGRKVTEPQDGLTAFDDIGSMEK